MFVTMQTTQHFMHVIQICTILNLKLEHDSILAIEWFECNYKKLNQHKCYLLISGHQYQSVCANFGSRKTWENNDQNLLAVNIYHNLKFSHYILKLH